MYAVCSLLMLGADLTKINSTSRKNLRYILLSGNSAKMPLLSSLILGFPEEMREKNRDTKALDIATHRARMCLEGFKKHYKKSIKKFKKANPNTPHENINQAYKEQENDLINNIYNRCIRLFSRFI